MSLYTPSVYMDEMLTHANLAEGYLANRLQKTIFYFCFLYIVYGRIISMESIFKYVIINYIIMLVYASIPTAR